MAVFTFCDSVYCFPLRDPISTLIAIRYRYRYRDLLLVFKDMPDVAHFTAKCLRNPSTLP